MLHDQELEGPLALEDGPGDHDDGRNEPEHGDRDEGDRDEDPINVGNDAGSDPEAEALHDHFNVS